MFNYFSAMYYHKLIALYESSYWGRNPPEVVVWTISVPNYVNELIKYQIHIPINGLIQYISKQLGHIGARITPPGCANNATYTFWITLCVAYSTYQATVSGHRCGVDIVPHTNALRMCRTRPSHVVAQPYSSLNPYQGWCEKCLSEPAHHATAYKYKNEWGSRVLFFFPPSPTQCPSQITNPDNRGEECSTSQALCKVSKVQLQVYYQYYLFYSYNRTFGNTG